MFVRCLSGGLIAKDSPNGAFAQLRDASIIKRNKEVLLPGEKFTYFFAGYFARFVTGRIL
jgi:hypothetical protein